MDVKQIRQLLDEIVRNTELSDANLRKLLVKELTDIQTRRKAELAEQERINRQKKREIQRNQLKSSEEGASSASKTDRTEGRAKEGSKGISERARLMRQKRRDKLAEKKAKKKK